MTKKRGKALGTMPILTLDGARAEIRLQRPELHNRLQPEDLEMIERLLGEIDAAPGIRVAVLASSGKTFSSGFDIGSIEGPADSEAAPHAFERMVNRLERLRVPTIAALQGSIYGGAADLALACDFRIGVEAMELRVPAALLGVHYYASGLRRFVNRVGPGAANRIFLLAETLRAGELLRIGYLDEVAATQADLDAAVERYAAQIVSLAPLAIEGMKRALNEAARGELDEKAAANRVGRALQSADLKEGIAAWAAQRAPRFSGK